MSDEIFIKIAEALATYEMDEPHDDDNPVGDEKITWSDIVMMQKLPHDHGSVTCRKCLADSWIHKARYISIRLNELMSDEIIKILSEIHREDDDENEITDPCEKLIDILKELKQCRRNNILYVNRIRELEKK